MKSNYEGDMSDEQSEDVRQKFYAGNANEREIILEELNMAGHTETADELECWQIEVDLQAGKDKDE